MNSEFRNHVYTLSPKDENISGNQTIPRDNCETHESEPTERCHRALNSKCSSKSSADKNYAPDLVTQHLRSLGVSTVSDSTKLYKKRREAATQRFFENAAPTTSGYMKKIEVSDKGKKAQVNRDAYLRRVAERQLRYEQHLPIPTNISPWLNMTLHPNTSIEERMFNYSKKHKCPHGRCWSVYTVAHSTLASGEKEPRYIVPSCNCLVETRTPKVVRHNCGRCTSVEQFSCRSKHLGENIDAWLCKYCHTMTYRYGPERRSTHFSNEVPIVAAVKEILSSTKTWEPLVPSHLPAPASADVEEFPSLPTASVPEFGFVDIKGFFTSFWDKITTAISSIKNYMGVLIVKRVVKAAAIDIWETITNSLDAIRAVVNRNPLIFGAAFYKMLMAEDRVERLMWLSALAAEESIRIGLVRILEFLGFPSSWLMSETEKCAHERIVNTEKERKDFLDRQQAKVVAAHILASHENDTPLWHDRPFTSEDRAMLSVPLDSDDDFVDSKPESGHDWMQIFLSALGFGHLRHIPTLMDLLKNFNTVVTGWKNVHELALNFFDHLPNWLSGIFTFSDPKKRYGFEAKNPGNPVYDAVESYKLLMSVGSHESYAEFMVNWKIAENYLIQNYPITSDFVFRIHKHLQITARSTMTPNASGARPVPFVVTVYGPPATGKSTMWPSFLSGIIDGNIADIKAMTYPRNVDSDYWDGYDPLKHKILCYDDAFHQVEDPCASELIPLVSSVDYLPNFAALDNPHVGVKGTAFTSPIIVLNSNFSTNLSHCKQVADSVALKRRLGHMIYVDQQWSRVDQRYSVEKMGYDGIPTVVGRLTLKEIQDYLKDEFVKHYAGQLEVAKTINAQKNDDPLPSFMNIVDEARKRLQPAAVYRMPVGDIPVPSQPQVGLATVAAAVSSYISKPILFWSAGTLVSYVYGLAAAVDSHFSAIGTACLAVSAGLATFFLAYKVFGMKKASADEAESGEGHQPKSGARVLFQRPVLSKPQVGEKAHENQINRLLQNQVMIISGNQYVNGLFISGRMLLLPRHFARIGGKMSIASNRSVDSELYEFDMTNCRVEYIDGADLAIAELPMHIHAYPNILYRIIDEAKYGNEHGYVTRRDPSSQTVFVHSTFIKPGHVLSQYTFGERKEFYYNLCYEFEHSSGDCGNLVLVARSGCTMIAGFHVSGDKTNKKNSHASMLNRSELHKYMQRFSYESTLGFEPEFKYEESVCETGVAMPNKIQYVVTTKVVVSSPQKSDLCPSAIHDLIRPHTMKPAILKRFRHNGEVVDPMVLALEKYGQSTKQFPLEQSILAAESIRDELMALVEPSDIRCELTESETINGIPGKVDSINMKSSAGYPHVLCAQERGSKRQFFDGEVGSLRPDRRFAVIRDHWETCFNNNLIPNDPFIITLKDETKPIEKVDAGKTRAFCAGSLTGFYWNKRLFGGFNAFMMRVRDKTFSTNGMNRASDEWNRMIERFLSISPFGIAGDQEKWDGRFKASLALLIVSVVLKAYYLDSSNQKRRLICFMHAIFAYVRVSWYDTSVIAQILSVMPSGWYMTFLVNSLVNAMLFRIAWIFLVAAPYNDLYYFRRYTADKYAGDDNVLAVAPEFLEMYNGISIQKFFAMYDQIYTSAKKGMPIAYEPIEELSFLKTVTGRRWERYVPLFELESNDDTTQWVRINGPSFDLTGKPTQELVDATEANCNDALRNHFWYGREHFDRERSLMLCALPTMNLLGFHALEKALLDYGEIPDPTGVFKYTRNKNRDTSLLFKALKSVLARQQAAKIATEVVDAEPESGEHITMNTLTLNDCFPSNMPASWRDVLCRISRIEFRTTFSKYLTVATVTDLVDLDFYINAFPLDVIRMSEHIESLREASYPVEHEDYETDLEKFIADVYELIEYHNKHSVDLDATIVPSEPESGRVEQPVAALVPQANEIVADTGSLDDSTPAVTTKVGVHLSEQQPKQTIKPVDGNFLPSFRRAEAHLNESAWDLEKMLLRENLVGAFNWAITDAVGKLIPIVGTGSTDVPADLLQNNLVASPFHLFNYWRAERIKVRFQLTASRFHQGNLGVWFHPTMMPKNNVVLPVPIVGLAPQTWTQLQHGFLDPANGTVFDMDIPFIFNKGWIDLTNFKDSLGQINVSVLNGLQAAAGASPSVEVKVFVSFEGSRFKVPIAGGDSYRTLVTREYERLNPQIIQSPAPLVKRINTPTRQTYDRQFVPPSEYADIESDLESEDFKRPIVRTTRHAVASRPQSGSFAVLGGALGSEIDSVVDSILPHQLTTGGILMDNPVVTEYPEPLVHKDQQYLSPSRGVQKLERMTLEPSAIYPTDDQLGSSIDEMDIKYLLKKECFLGTVNWPATAAVGTILDSGIVSPTHFDNVAPSKTNPSYTSIMFFLSQFFTYWRGSFELIFHVIGTAFHEGRLDISSHPNVMVPPADYVTSQSQYTLSHTVRNVDNTIRVVFPHLADVPWKRIWTNQTLSQTPLDHTFRFSDFAHGSWSIRVAVPLKAPNNVAQNVDINMFLRAGEDFEFHFLSPMSGFMTSQHTDNAMVRRRLTNKARTKEVVCSEPQAGETKAITGERNSRPASDSTALPLAVDRALTKDMRIPHFGESYTNLREMCKRYALQYKLSDAHTSPATPVIFNLSIDLPQYSGMIGALSRCFRLFRGSMNFKTEMRCISTDESAGGIAEYPIHGYVTIIPQSGTYTAPLATAGNYLSSAQVTTDQQHNQVALVRLSNRQVAEYSVPYMSTYHSLKIAQDFDTHSSYYDDEFTHFQLVASLNFGAMDGDIASNSVYSEIELTSAFSDETRLGVWMGTPALYLPQTTLYPY